ncbi:hypothetical protein ACRRTK_014250 [Alexandromys fortis]
MPLSSSNDLVSSLGVSTCATLSCLGSCEVAGIVPVDGRVAPAWPRCKQDSSRFLQRRCHLQAAARIAAAFAKPKTSERPNPTACRDPRPDIRGAKLTPSVLFQGAKASGWNLGTGTVDSVQRPALQVWPGASVHQPKSVGTASKPSLVHLVRHT